MSHKYLEQDQLTELFTAAVGAGFVSQESLEALKAGMNPSFALQLPSTGNPANALMTTLNRLNQVEKLVGGEVPLQVWLKNATTLSAHLPAGEIYRKALDRISTESSGEPEVPGFGTGGEEPPSKEIQEEIVFRDDTLPFSFLQEGYRRGLSVARLTVTRHDGGQPRVIGRQGNRDILDTHRGTGWLITPELLVTNQHVVKARPATQQPSVQDMELQVSKLEVEFDAESETARGPMIGASQLEATDIALDYAVLRLKENPPGHPEEGERSPLRVLPTPLAVDPSRETVAVNIIQHPDGGTKRIACRNNLVQRADDRDLRYFTDTKHGSSGSPVFDDRWRVVALHRGATSVDGIRFQGRPVAWVNVGTQMAAVFADLANRHAALLDEIRLVQQQLGAPGW